MIESWTEVRRARPLLGTIVDITVRARTREAANRAVNAAFASIARVHALMSYHEAGSDVTRLNRLAHVRRVQVHPWTWKVLSAAHELARATRGAFDVTVAGRLMRLGYLPTRQIGAADAHAGWRDIELAGGRYVRFRRRLWIDLGGIAKGYAVDRAVQVLRAFGIDAGIVNAGGDLRAFGSTTQRVHIRDPSDPAHLFHTVDLYQQALATTAHYHSTRVYRGRRCTPCIDPLRRQSITRYASVSVVAPSCMMADALTKVVMVRGPGSLGRFGASAVLLHEQPLNRGKELH